ncbi:hypothetical protein Cpir12675_005314 [Ceratocystis pirilliformis]|uniref:CWH43-like N-terminal domain-containing protein n=1 Tax=Ceratocystis pirilliformis TaxID=259994 RepID=A0ABR3YQI3_9PEZI
MSQLQTATARALTNELIPLLTLNFTDRPKSSRQLEANQTRPKFIIYSSQFTNQMLPVISGVTWLGMLLAMLIYWAGTQDAVHLVDMNEHQSIAYISDVGALTLKPLFIAGCAVTSVFFAVSFIATRWLRHRGRLLPNVTMFQKILMCLNIFSAIVGTAGLIFLSIFDAYRHSGVHNACLVLFLLGFIISAIFACWEFHSLRHCIYALPPPPLVLVFLANNQLLDYVDEPHLKASFYTKLVFIIFEGSLAILFGILFKTHKRNAAAVVEWILAFIFSFYVFSYVMDLWPAVHTKKPEMRYQKPQRLVVGSSGESPHTLEQAIVPPPPPPPEAHMGHF